MVKALENNAFQKEAAEALKEAGPVAEVLLIPLLHQDNLVVQESVCEVLAVIGTEQSVSHLTPLTALADSENPGGMGIRERRTGAAAANAIEAIRAAGREPVEPSPVENP